MPRVGFTLAALLAAGPVASAQQPPVSPYPPTAPAGLGFADPARLPTPGTGGVPALPVANVPGQPAAVPPGANPQLVAHVQGWADVMTKTVNFGADFALTRTETVFGKKKEFTGKVLCMKPNLARLRLDEQNNPTAYEAFICDGRSVFHYSGSEKSLTQHQLGPTATADNLMLDFLSGLSADAALKRFNMALFKEDNFYVYLDIKPKLPADQQEFTHVRFAIYGPNTPLKYLPSQVWLQKPNGDTELWKFSNPQKDIPGVAVADFQAVKPPQGWRFQQAQAAPGGAAPGTPPVKARPVGP